MSGLRAVAAHAPEPEPGTLRAHNGQQADLFNFRQYSVMAVCHACEQPIRASSFFRPFAHEGGVSLAAGNDTRSGCCALLLPHGQLGHYVRMSEMRVLAGRYRLTKLLGRGGFSEVWQAEDSLLGRAVAVKVFTASAGQADLVARFHREARTVAGLRHPNVVVVFDAGIDGDVPTR